MFVEPPGGLGDARVAPIGGGISVRRMLVIADSVDIRQRLGPGLDRFVGLQHPHAQGLPGDRLADAAREQLELVDRVGRVGLADGADYGVHLAGTCSSSSSGALSLTCDWMSEPIRCFE